MTFDGIAAAFGLPIVVSESIMGRLNRALKDDPNESQRKMAMIPEGAKLIDSGDLWFPLVVVDNVYIFPGIPELLRKKFDSARERFRGVPFVLRRVFVRSMESEIAEDLHALLGDFPELQLGSYPKIQEESYRVLLTLESRDGDYVQRALDSLLERLPDDAIHKVE